MCGQKLVLNVYNKQYMSVLAQGIHSETYISLQACVCFTLTETKLEVRNSFVWWSVATQHCSQKPRSVCLKCLMWKIFNNIYRTVNRNVVSITSQNSLDFSKCLKLEYQNSVTMFFSIPCTSQFKQNIDNDKIPSHFRLSHRYRTYMRPRYKVAYKMVTEMEWKCCHGYSGEDCNDGPNGGSNTQISTVRPWPKPSQPGQTGAGTGQGQSGGNGKSIIYHITHSSKKKSLYTAKNDFLT